MKWEMKKKPSGNFLSNSRKICRHFAFLVHQKADKFLNVMFKGVDGIFVILFQLLGYSMFLVQDRKRFFDQDSFVERVGLV